MPPPEISIMILFYMKEILKINRVEIILEERKVNPHFHIWLLPLWEDIIDKYEIDPKVWNSNILQKDGELNELVEY